MPAAADFSSPLGTFLSSTSTALSKGDISSAQSALTTLENNRSSIASAASAASVGK
jgi:hypothetical protein